MGKSTWIGRTLSARYVINDLLGQGGMSAVYKATDPNLKRVVAIKLIHEHLSADPGFVRRFESEASAVASLRHPNIVQVYDFNSDNETFYMVLEFIPGETLGDRLRRLAGDNRKLPLEDALKFTLNISDAMGYAHQRGIVHRDIKPANIMLDVQGQAILMDFGIVKIAGGDSHTSTGAIVGTARYMSPEIIRGETADNRSDIYSLGVTLFEMLSGRLPFVADSAMTLMMMHLNDPVPDVREFRGDVHPEIVSILSKCLTKDRNERYQSAGELSADLRRALASIAGQSTSIKDTAKSQPAPTQLKPQPVPIHDATEIATQVDSQPHPQPTSQSDARTEVEPVPLPARSTPPQPLPPVQTTSTPIASQQSKPAAKSNRTILLVGAGLVGILCLSAVLVLGNSLLNAGGTRTSSEPTQTLPIPTNTVPVVVAEATATVSPTPTDIPTETVPPPTPTPVGPYVVITGIRIENNVYVVDYEVGNFTPDPPLHVHMFFNTVPPERAGSPASGPWELTWGVYGDPPFTKYGPANRPANATQMCALVANRNHAIILGTGNCVDLP
jgi:serine/threonine protein kinase